MYSFDNFSSSLGTISSALVLPVSRGRHRKLVDNFSHESDVPSLQDPFTSRPYQTPFYFYYCVPRKIRRGILPKKQMCARTFLSQPSWRRALQFSQRVISSGFLYKQTQGLGITDRSSLGHKSIMMNDSTCQSYEGKILSRLRNWQPQ